jgi:hypothetical protein
LNTGPSDLETNMTYGPLASPDCPVNVTCITRGQTTMTGFANLRECERSELGRYLCSER